MKNYKDDISTPSLTAYYYSSAKILAFQFGICVGAFIGLYFLIIGNFMVGALCFGLLMYNNSDLNNIADQKKNTSNNYQQLRFRNTLAAIRFYKMGRGRIHEDGYPQRAFFSKYLERGRILFITIFFSRVGN